MFLQNKKNWLSANILIFKVHLKVNTFLKTELMNELKDLFLITAFTQPQTYN